MRAGMMRDAGYNPSLFLVTFQRKIGAPVLLYAALSYQMTERSWRGMFKEIGWRAMICAEFFLIFFKPILIVLGVISAGTDTAVSANAVE
jgi:hypothetical protein